MNTAILLYDGFTALDAIGPYEVLSRLPGAARDVRRRRARGRCAPTTACSRCIAERSLADVRAPEIVLVPGRPGRGRRTRRRPGARVAARGARDEHVDDVGVHRLADPRARRACSTGKRATSHWLALDEARASLGAEPVSERVVFDGKIVTAAGVSAGIDMALALAAEIAGDQVAQAIQLGIEYDPQPPFDAGSPQKAPAEIVELLRGNSRFVFGDEALAKAS